MKTKLVIFAILLLILGSCKAKQCKGLESHPDYYKMKNKKN